MANKTQAELNEFTKALLDELPEELARDEYINMIEDTTYAFVRFPKNAPCIMRRVPNKRKNVGDWFGYTGWDMSESKKTQLQKECEKELLKRTVHCLKHLDEHDQAILEDTLNMQQFREFMISRDEVIKFLKSTLM